MATPKAKRLSDAVVRLVSRGFLRVGAAEVSTGAFARLETWARGGVCVYLGVHRDPLATPGYQILMPAGQQPTADAMFKVIDNLTYMDDLERKASAPPASVTTGTDAPKVPDEIIRKGP